MIYFHLKHGYCICTELEKRALSDAGKLPYKGGFYQHYLFRRLLKKEVSNAFARKFLIYTKVIPGLIPAIYPLLRLVIKR